MAESKIPDPGKPLTEDQFVKVQPKDGGEPLPDPIPKHWIGTDLAPNVKRASSRSSSSSDKGGGGTPAKSASKADWVAYATGEDRGDDQLTEEQADDLTRDQLAERYSGSST